MIVYAKPMAVESYASFMALDESELDYDIEWLEPGVPMPETVTLGIAPCCVLPDDATITGAMALIHYLGRTAGRWPTPEGAALAHQRFVAQFALSQIAPATSDIFHRRVVAPRVGLDVDDGPAAEAWAWIAEPQGRLSDRSRLDILEGTVINKWFSADTLGLASICVAAALAPLALADESLESWPELSRVRDVLHERESMAEQLAEVRDLLG